MSANDYLKRVLKDQTFKDSDPELKGLRSRREDIAKKLRDHFGDSAISTRWAGAMAKGTMIKESYDGDVTCYFNHDDTGAGETLAEIYEHVADCLLEDYNVERKPSAIRVREQSWPNSDLHVDVVPGRYTGNDKTDVNLHRTTGDKRSLKTNLQTHIDHVKNSGVVDAIRLMKLWNVRNGVGAKTFVLELLVVKLLSKKKALSLSDQLADVWTEFRDNSENLVVEDPANPTGNDLKPALDLCRSVLQTVASSTLWHVENDDWEAVFGKVEDEESDEDRTVALSAAAASVKTQTRPWANA